MLACLYPTKVLFLDDNETFLTTLVKNYENCFFYSESHTNINLVKKILDVQTGNDFLYKYFKAGYEESIGDRAINIKISNIKNEYFRNNKSEEVSVLVIDNEMPQMYGIEFLKLLKNPNIYRILLTGTVNDHLAIEAFNNGLVDNYINKSDISLYEKLETQVTLGIKQYLKKKSNLIMQSILLDSSRKTALGSELYSSFFDEVIKKFNIKEYYLIDAQGSYLMLDTSGNIYTLLMVGDDSLIAQIDLLEEVAAEINLIQEVKSKKKMCYITISDISNEVKIFELDKTISNLESFMYDIFPGDVLSLTG